MTEEVPETFAVVDVTESWFQQHEPVRHRGKRSNYSQSVGTGHEFHRWEYLTHFEGPKELPGPVHPLFEQGLRHTRFKRGLYRRHQSKILQDIPRLEKEVSWALVGYAGPGSVGLNP